MKSDVVEEVRKFVEKESRKLGAKYGYEPYEFHLIPMRDYAVELAKKLSADAEIVEIAAWSHDIGSIIYGRAKYHLTGVKIMGRKLLELNYPKKKINPVLHCILSHRSSNGIKPKTIEAKIISDADAMSNFDNIAGIFKAAFVYEGQTQGEAKKTTKEKLVRKWNKLYLNESKKLVKPKYEAAMLLLS